MRRKFLGTIGITDAIDIPDAGLYNLPCKIDTGADTSAVHCERIRIKEINGTDYLVFKLLDRHHPMYSGVEIRTKDFKEKKVKSSFGDYEYRYQVNLNIIIFGQKIKAAFNLSNRRNMKFPVLIGRKFLSHRFMVDVTQHNLSLNQKQQNENSDS